MMTIFDIISNIITVAFILTLGLEAWGVFKPSLRSRLFYAMVRYGYKPLTSNLPLAKRKARMELLRHLVPRDITTRSIMVGDIPAEWVHPIRYSKDHALLYLHGGSYTMGSPALHRDLVHRIARRSGMSAVAIDYRLAPEHPYPAALEDAVFAYHWLLEQGVAPENVAIAGDSAGGGLTLALLMYLRDHGDPLPAAAALLAPWTDLTMSTDSDRELEAIDAQITMHGLLESADAYRGEHDAAEPLISPLFGDLHNLPPLLILAGTDEMLVDDSILFAEKANQAEVDVTLQIREHMGHVYPAFAMIIPEGRQAIRFAGTFIRRHTGNE
jgi:epsilon-lactone hydrolase